MSELGFRFDDFLGERQKHLALRQYLWRGVEITPDPSTAPHRVTVFLQRKGPWRITEVDDNRLHLTAPGAAMAEYPLSSVVIDRS